MCEPATIAAISLATTAASTGLQMYSANEQGKAAEAQADYQAQQLKNNALVSERLAVDAEQRGEQEKALNRRRVTEIQRTQRQSFAANNVIADAGSAGDLIVETGKLGARDTEIIGQNAAREAFGFRHRASQQLGQARLTQAAGQDARRSGFLAAVGAGLGGTSQLTGNYLDYKKQGIY